MPITLWPANAVAGAPSYTGRMLRQALGVLLAGATAARPLGGRNGVRPGTSGLVSATSTTWTVNPHAGALDLESPTAAGPYYYSVDDTTNTGSVTAADATNPRIDIVYATLNDPAEGDGSSTPGVVFGYLAGTPSPSPAAPATPARSMVVSTISVPKVGSGAPTTTDAAPFTVAAGAPIPVRTQAERDALSLYDGLQVYRLDTHTVETYNGTVWIGSWIAYTPTVKSNSVAVTLAAGSATGRYQQIGKTVHYIARFTLGAGTTFNSAGAITISLPAAPGTPATRTGFGNAVGIIPGGVFSRLVRLLTGFDVLMVDLVDNQISSTTYAWAAGNYAEIYGTYDVT